MKTLQKEFNTIYKKNVPWKQHPESINNAMLRTDRYLDMKKSKATDDEIYEAFFTPVKMKIFTWDGPKDTTMTPMDSLKHYLYFLNCGFMSMNPKTGHIKAWVGGVDYKFFKVDHVTTERQPGSTFKPFTYAYAVDNGIPPCTYFSNTPPVFKGFESWQPKNADGSYGGGMSMRAGIALSVNCIAAQVLSQFNESGPQGVIDLCRKMGIRGDLKPYPTICLGVFDVTVFDMIGAYSTFANQGVWTEPVFITKIVDKNGNLLQDFSPRTVEAMGADKAYVMLDMMKGCVNFGTGIEVRTKYGINTPIAAKTGTTSSYADGWFIGITPELVSGGWVGNDDRTIHFPDIYHGCGGHMSLPIWAYYMQKVYADKSLNLSVADFEYPKTEIKVDMNCTNNDDAESYKNYLIGY
jgi:penicillin-binding protein 1A